MINLIVISN